MNIKNVKQITVQDWDKFVKETYGKPYSFQQQDDCKGRGVETICVPTEYPEDYEATEIPFEINGEEMGISFETWLNTTPEYIKSKFTNDKGTLDVGVNLFWYRNFYPHVDMIINDLHKKGLLEEGEYQIIIDW